MTSSHQITIPPRAVEAAAEAEYMAQHGGSSQLVPWASAPNWIKETCRARATAALRAGLMAWPGFENGLEEYTTPKGRKHHIIVLSAEIEDA